MKSSGCCLTNGMQTKENRTHQPASWPLIASWYYDKNSGCCLTDGMQPKENESHQLASWLPIVNWYKKQRLLFDQWHADKRK